MLDASAKKQRKNKIKFKSNLRKDKMSGIKLRSEGDLEQARAPSILNLCKLSVLNNLF